MKANADHRHQVSQESTILRGVIVRTLRTPKNHRLGRITITLLPRDYPVLTGEAGRQHLDDITQEIASSGYRVSVTRDDTGKTDIVIDWTSVPPAS